MHNNNLISLAEKAYITLEEMIITLELKPGKPFLKMKSVSRWASAGCRSGRLLNVWRLPGWCRLFQEGALSLAR